jgi:hypothetical protein
MTLSEGLLIVIALSAVLTAAVLAVLAVRIARAVGEVQRLANDVHEMLPKIDHILEATDREIDRVQGVADRVDRIAADVEVITKKASRAIVPALDLVSNISKPARYVSAALTGLGVGLSVIRRLKGSSTDADPESTDGVHSDGNETPPDAARSHEQEAQK